MSQTPTSAFADFLPGHVWLVGAGPGDAGLLTRLGEHALRTCDVLVYDALVSEDILALVNPQAERIYAGKRGGKPSPKQADITERLIGLAQAGNRVCRLKGGDPLVFGRGGEEALGLVAADVPFRIVPGITAGIGGLAYAGIPLTHREVNTSVTFLTGHAMTGELPENLDWKALASASPVLVFYMAIRQLPKIQAALLAAGRDPSVPAAAVSNATTPDQQVLETTLGQLAQDAEKHNVRPPSIIVIGDVVHLRRGLDWQGALEGRTLTPTPLD